MSDVRWSEEGDSIDDILEIFNEYDGNKSVLTLNDFTVVNFAGGNVIMYFNDEVNEYYCFTMCVSNGVVFMYSDETIY